MEKYEKDSRYYNENSFWVKIKKLAGKASSSLLYYALCYIIASSAMK